METEQPKPIQTEAMTVGPSRLIDVQDQSKEGLELFREAVKAAKEKLKIAFGLCAPGQIVVMAQTSKSGGVKESIYVTGAGADRILRHGFGMSWGEKQIEIVRDENRQPIAAICRATLRKASGQDYEAFEGRRALGGYVKNENDLVKASEENMKHRAVSAIIGTGFLTPLDLAEALGTDIAALPRRVEFREHGADESGTAVVPWGKKQGTPVTELEERDLDYYAGRARESIADPTKAKYAAKEKTWLAAIEAEQARRKAPPVPTAAEADADELEKLCIQIAEVSEALGIPDTTIKTGLASMTTVAKAKKFLADLQARAAKANASEEA